MMQTAHERATPHVGFDKPETVIGMIGRRRVVQCQEHPRHRLQDEEEQRG